MADCVTKIELTVACTDLLDKDVGSKSDPLCVLLQSSGGDKWTEVTHDSQYSFISDLISLQAKLKQTHLSVPACVCVSWVAPSA